MGGPPNLIELAAIAPSWDARVAAIRRVPEEYGLARHQAVYAELAERIYVPSLTPDFGYIHWRPEYELAPLAAAYEAAATATHGFAEVSPAGLALVVREQPTTLRVFRLLLGLTTAEFSEATGMVTTAATGKATLAKVEAGAYPTVAAAEACAAVIDQMMRGRLFPPGVDPLRSKVDKNDTEFGWDSVRRYAREGCRCPCCSTSVYTAARSASFSTRRVL